MMNDYRQYLLYTDESMEAFKAKYAGHIEKNRDRFREWIAGLPCCERVEYLKAFPEHQRPFVVGLLCLLVLDGSINVTFHDRAQILHRNPSSVQEWEAWCKAGMPRKRPLRSGR